jgi:prephenate dehydratase
MKKVAIQGFEGSFHHIAEVNYFGTDIELNYCYTFREVARKVQEIEINYGVMAVVDGIYKKGEQI